MPEMQIDNEAGRQPGPGYSFGEEMGLRIRARRRRLKLTQKQVAQDVGVTPQQIHKYETGQSVIACSRLWNISRALGCSAASLFGEG